MSGEYKSRIQQFMDYLEQQSLDMAIITSPVHIYFFTGYYSDPHERFLALLLDRRAEEVTLFVPSLDLESARQASIIQEMIPVSDTENPYQLLSQKMGRQVVKLGIEKKAVNLFQYEQLNQCAAIGEFVDLEPFILSLRLIKSASEIESVRKAVAVVERVLAEGVKRVKPRVSELELVAELEYQMKLFGAERPAFETTVLTGSRSALPHGRPNQTRINQGDFLLFDLGVFVNGYCSDITRTFVIGEATKEQQRIYETVLRANLKAIESVQRNQEIGMLDQEARKVIEHEGFGDYFIHRVGHGLGLEIHENPSIHQQNKLMIEPGMLFTIEPGIYIPGMGGVRIEDDIVVNAEGKAEVLTTYPKTIQYLC
ncbi:M24 family metallopeptidase [Ammoniphilus resinae]|uniref:Xaa-Pro dipeptidase n=1 Tax=Ammoniphilus resinae TaxID=861532 RepID=A0ABS4GUH5_9BACL|nr:Xaa-Pro peptidase family protein [Ammoniphilus resinae]MBP1933917.1 Xaa-Pro dipeptidase [Ammoniphilus resinae]